MTPWKLDGESTVLPKSWMKVLQGWDKVQYNVDPSKTFVSKSTAAAFYFGLLVNFD